MEARFHSVFTVKSDQLFMLILTGSFKVVSVKALNDDIKHGFPVLLTSRAFGFLAV